MGIVDPSDWVENADRSGALGGARLVPVEIAGIKAQGIIAGDHPIQRQVDEEMGLLSITLDDLQEAARELSRSLAPVMRDMSPNTTPDECATAEAKVLVPLADLIRAHRNRAHSVLSLIRSVTDRLEI